MDAREADLAEDTARRAIAAAPRDGRSHRALGTVLGKANRPEDALAAFDMAADCGLGSALVSKASHLMELGRMEEAGALLDRLVGYGPEIVAAAWMLRADLKGFAPRLVEDFLSAGSSSQLPIFIIGMPRSGTTLVEQILASHPQVFGAGELSLMQDVVDRIAGPDGQPAGYLRLMTSLTHPDMAELGEYYAAVVADMAPGKLRVVDKMPQNFLYAGLIALMLPQARIIHCRRDAIDTCRSCYAAPFASGLKFAFDLAELGQFHNDYSRLMNHWHAVIPPGRILDMHYEDVVDDLEGSARRLVEFCGLAWDDGFLDFHRTDRTVRTASMSQVRQPIYRSSVGRWRPYADQLGPLLAALGRGR